MQYLVLGVMSKTTLFYGTKFGEEESILGEVFEQELRTGRKKNTWIRLSSSPEQSPSEPPQKRKSAITCSSFIVHRLQSTRRIYACYFKDIVPGVFEGPWTNFYQLWNHKSALVLGECSCTGLVRIRDAHPPPQSRDPKVL